MSKRKGKRKGKGQRKQERAYEAALATPQRRLPINSAGSQDSATDEALEKVRQWGRYLDENHDLASGVLDELVKNIVGTGIQTIPKPLRSDGSIDEPLGEEIMREFTRWTRAADVTGELSWSEAQRLICRAWFRDGEEFVQHVSGRDRGYPFVRDMVPYRIELLESELVPWELTNDQGWRQGVRHDSWNRPTAYGVYRGHPGDSVRGFFGSPSIVNLDDVKTVGAENITHIKFVKRWPATRGMSLFSDVIARLYDVKDLEESERIKNRILASWCAAITKSPDVPGTDDTDTHGARYLQMAGGTVIDTLAPGENITGVGPDYPVSDMPDYIADQIRRVASGTGTRYSSIAKKYDGNYASQRQELVESEGHYQMREDAFTAKVVRTVYERWLLSAIADGKISVRGGDFFLIANAEYRGPVTPWIDPLKEVQADALAVSEGFQSIDQIRIKRGAPAEMIGEPAPTPAREPRQLPLIEEEDEAEDQAA